MDPEKEREEEERGLKAMILCMKVAGYQISQGRYFALEHPSSASSWGLRSVEVLLERPEVRMSR
eukprot:9281114-Pyramimonas_sp.AAC.1